MDVGYDSLFEYASVWRVDVLFWNGLQYISVVGYVKNSSHNLLINFSICLIISQQDLEYDFRCFSDCVIFVSKTMNIMGAKRKEYTL